MGLGTGDRLPDAGGGGGCRPQRDQSPKALNYSKSSLFVVCVSFWGVDMNQEYIRKRLKQGLVFPAHEPKKTPQYTYYYEFIILIFNFGNGINWKSFLSD